MQSCPSSNCQLCNNITPTHVSTAHDGHAHARTGLSCLGPAPDRSHAGRARWPKRRDARTWPSFAEKKCGRCVERVRQGPKRQKKPHVALRSLCRTGSAWSIRDRDRQRRLAARTCFKRTMCCAAHDQNGAFFPGSSAQPSHVRPLLCHARDDTQPDERGLGVGAATETATTNHNSA